MIRRLLYCYLALLLIPISAWAQEVQPDSTTAQVEPAIIEPVQLPPAKPVPVPASPAYSLPAQSSPTSATPKQPTPGKPATAQPAPLQPQLFKPASAPAAPPAPRIPAPANPAIVQPPTAKPAQLQAPAIKPASAPVAQSATKPPAPSKIQPLPEKQASSPLKPAKPAHILPIPIQSATVQAESAAASISKPVDIEVFVREGCAQCDKATEFLAKLKNLQPQLKINLRDVRKEPAALALLIRMTQNQGDAALDYPAFVMNGQLIIGFSEEANTAQLILDKLAANNPDSEERTLDAENCKTGKELSCGIITPAPVEKPEKIIISFMDYSIPLAQIGLPLFTVAMGLLDGFNHGSTWVLILMISLLTPMKNRTVMLAVAGTFIAVQGIVYFVYMSLWLNVFKLVGTSYISEAVIATIAILTGAIYFKNYLHFDRNISISTHEISKPGIYTRIRKILQAENLASALLATTILAVLVQLGEFSYKSIFPAMYTRVLTLQQLDSLSNYGYLLLYNAAYMLDDIVLLAMAVFTLKHGIEKERQGRMLLLISGLTMVCLGAYMLFTLR